MHSTEIRNSNLEILNNIEIQNSNVPNVFGIYDFENWDLFRISNLGFRASALCAGGRDSVTETIPPIVIGKTRIRFSHGGGKGEKR